MLKGGGGTKSFEVVLKWGLGSFSHSDWEGGGCKKFYPVLRGRGHNKFWTDDFRGGYRISERGEY